MHGGALFKRKGTKICYLKSPYSWANWWALLLTKLVKLLTKRVFLFAHETSAHETSFFFCSRNECSRNEFELVRKSRAVIWIFLVWKRGRFYRQFLIFFFQQASSSHLKNILVAFCCWEKLDRNILFYLFYDLLIEVFTKVLKFCRIQALFSRH